MPKRKRGRLSLDREIAQRLRRDAAAALDDLGSLREEQRREIAATIKRYGVRRQELVAKLMSLRSACAHFGVEVPGLDDVSLQERGKRRRKPPLQDKIMAALENGPMTAKEMAETEGIEALGRSVAKALRRLEEVGAVVRQGWRAGSTLWAVA